MKRLLCHLVDVGHVGRSGCACPHLLARLFLGSVVNLSAEGVSSVTGSGGVGESNVARLSRGSVFLWVWIGGLRDGVSRVE